jgi:uncharacterized protein (TIGR02118 family)
MKDGVPNGGDAMFTVMFVVHGRDDMEHAESLRYWRETHGPIVAKVPGVRGYVQHHAVAAPGGDPPFLGVAVITLDDEEAWKAAAASPELAAAIEDLGKFGDPSRLPTVFAETVTIV